MSADERRTAPWWELLVRVSVTADTEKEAVATIARSGIASGGYIGEVFVLDVEPVQRWES